MFTACKTANVRMDTLTRPCLDMWLDPFDDGEALPCVSRYSSDFPME